MAGSNTRWSNGFHGKSIKDEDFDEEETWGYVRERKEEETSAPMSTKLNHFKSSGSSSSSSSSWRMQINSAPKMIPKAKTTANQEPKTMKRSSAPLEIPDWSKIYGRNGNMGSWINDEYGLVDGAACNGFVNDDDEEEDVMVPPHEWIARKLARSQISSFSVCEGIGRTLKGRDLSKVRNAILTKTGFLE